MLKFVYLLALCLPAFAQEPPRKALLGLIPAAGQGELTVDSILPNSSFAALKLRKGDIIREINNVPINSKEDYGRLAPGFRAGDKITVKFSRGGKESTATAAAVMRPFETSPIADVRYDWVKFRDGQLRVITRFPKTGSNFPAILLIPGYGCGSIENYSNSYNGKLMNEWLKAGFAVVTIEKSGLGDSYKTLPCGEVDLVIDIESFDAGYRYMESLPQVDRTRLVVWGHSMGGVIAPEVARRHKPKGVIVFGATFRPWSEFLLEMHRVQKPLLENMDYLQTEAFIKTIQKVYYEFFVLKRTPEELHRMPEYSAIVESELGFKENSNDMWGRHWRYWQQLDSFNLAESWRAISCPVLVIHGEADYEQCSPLEPLLMVETVNQVHPGNATLVKIPDLDHFMMRSANWQEARDNFKSQQYNKGNFNYRIAEESIKWLKMNVSH